MMTYENLIRCINYLVPVTVGVPAGYSVGDAGGGDFAITHWDAARLGPQPTADQLAAAQLPATKAARCQAITQRTQQILARGFVFQGTHFSLDPITHQNLNTLFTLAAAGVLPFPTTITAADFSSFSVPDVATLNQLCNTAFAMGNAVYRDGQTLLNAVLAATTVAAVNAIQDTRS
jgi:hypothetical protein